MGLQQKLIDRLVECRRTLECVDRWRLRNTVGQRELEVLLDELAEVVALDVVGLLELHNLQDMNAAKAGAVATGHILVECLDGICARQLTELFIHIVGSGARVVAQPDTEVLHLGRAFFVDLVNRHDLTVGLLNTAQALQEVPEARLRDNDVWCEDAHAVELRLWRRLGGQMAADHLVLVHASHVWMASCRYRWCSECVCVEPIVPLCPMISNLLLESTLRL